ncbi:MAG: relaxase MobL [Clostridiales bacterium]|nr:relaxase MobL [Clostridiales bacterium]
MGGYARYIATREGVEKLDDSHRYAPTTKKQQALVEKILRDFPEIKESQEYEDFQRNQTVGNASEFISMAIEENMEAVASTKTYADYIATRPRAERFGSHGLFTDEGVEVQLSKVSQELNAYKGNIYTAILSLKREDAARLGFDSGSRWRDFLRGQTQTLSENLKIPMDHLRWYAAFHNEGHHPHVHLIAYSTVPGEGHLSKQGMENMRSVFAREIFSQELLFTYQQQTEYRDWLREQGRESISDIVAQINAGEYQNPRIEELLIRLADRLSRTIGKKVYGYLKPDAKAIVDQIVAELAGDESIRKLYDLWYEQREDVLRTYTDTFPDRVPLEQNKEFKSIRNAVIQEAMKITPQVWQKTNAGPQLRTEEEQPFSKNEFRPPYPMRQQEKEDDGDNDSAILEEQRPTETVDESERINPVEPVYLPSVARSVSALMAQLARLFQEQDQQREQNQRQQMDRKQRREISEKKQAMGIRD